MSNTINTRSTFPAGLANRPKIDLAKQPSRDSNPLSAVNPDPLTRAPDQPETSAQKARKAAEGLVSTTFIEPILKQMRESNNTPPPFGPGKAEKQFATLLDTQLADKIVHAANFPLVERITNDILRNMPADPAAPQTPKQTLDIKG